MSPGPSLYIRSETVTGGSEDAVPEPPQRLSRSYAGYINEEDVNDWLAAKLLIRQILPTILDVKHSWGQQDSRKSALLSTVLSSFPAFQKYESNWPILYYCYQYLGGVRKKNGEAWRSKRRTTTSKSTAGDMCTRRNTRSRSQSTFSMTSGPEARRTSPFSEATTSATTPDGVSPLYIEIMRGEQEVTTFLRAVDRMFDSSRFLDRFMTAGVNNGARLEDMGRWSVADRDTFLRCEVRLNAFECKLISDALHRIVSQTEE